MKNSISLLLALVLWGGAANCQTMAVTLNRVSDNGTTQHYSLRGTAVGNFNTGPYKSWGVSNVTLKLPTHIPINDGSMPAGLTLASTNYLPSPYITNISSGFTAYSYADQFGQTPVANGLALYTLSELGGTDDGFVYMTMNSSTSNNQSFANGNIVSILDFDLPSNWGTGACPSCITIVTADPPGLFAQIYTAISNSGVNSGQDNVATFTVLTSPLPVTLTNFAVAKGASCGVNINWQVASEIDLSRYEVQRSTSSDASSFVTIGTIAAAHKSSYVATDNNPANGLNFYRLRAVDIDGKLSYSKTVSLNIGCKGAISVWPNPATNVITVEGLSGTNTIVIMNATGSKVKTVYSTLGTEVINISSLPSGAYTIQVVNGSGAVINNKLVKK